MLGRFSFFKKQDFGSSKTTEIPEKFKYCPSCGDEFRADITRCAACDVELVSRDGTEVLSGADNRSVRREVISISSGDELATIKKGGLADVKALQRLLLKEGVDSLIAGDGPNGGKGCCNSSAFDLNVRKDDFADALAVLENEFKRTTGLEEHDYSGSAEAVFDERSGSVSCPACGSVFVPHEEIVCPECGLCF